MNAVVKSIYRMSVKCAIDDILIFGDSRYASPQECVSENAKFDGWISFLSISADGFRDKLSGTIIYKI